MANTFRLPDAGEGLTEAQIVRWLVDVGDHVEIDQSIVEIETDKALMEIPSPFAGTVLARGAEEGAVLEVGAMLVVIGDPGEDVEASDVAAPDTDETEVPETEESAPIVGTISSDAVDLSEPASERDDGVGDRAAVAPSDRTVQTLPMIRQMAHELGVDLTTIEGSGPGGRVTRDDVQRAAERTDASAPSAEVSASPADGVDPDDHGSSGGPDSSDIVPPPPEATSSADGERMSSTRRAIAEHMQRSWREIPHVTTFDRADVGKLLEAKRALERRRDERVSMDALVVAAVTAALEAHPVVAARVEGDRIVPADAIDVGVAVDTPEGLVVAVVASPAELDLIGLSAEIERLATAAGERRLPPDRMRGQCFTVSNIGAVGGWYGTPIVPYGTSAILSVGRATDEPVVRNGGVRVATVMPLSLSYDHRLVDGAAGRAFIGTIVENLEEPALFLA